MEKIKNLLSGNKSHDEEQLYGSIGNEAVQAPSTKGKITGDGSHLGIVRGNEVISGNTSTIPGTLSSGGADPSLEQIGTAVPKNSGVGASGGVLTGSGTHADPTIPSSSTLYSTSNTPASPLLSNSTSDRHGKDSYLCQDLDRHPTANTGYPGMTQDSRQAGSKYAEDSTGSATSHSTHNTGRGAAVLGSAGAIGTDALHHHEKERELASSTSTATSGASRGLHHAGPSIGQQTLVLVVDLEEFQVTVTANKLDPNINSDGPLEHGIVHSKWHGGGAESADKDHADAGQAVRAGHGSTGAMTAEQERQKFQIDRDNVGGASGVEHHGTSGSPGNHLGRDAAVVGGVGGAALASEHLHDRQTRIGTSKPDSQSTTGSASYHLSRDAAVAGGTAGVGDAVLAEHHHNRESQSGTSNLDSQNEAGSFGHHYGRDTAVAGGAAGVSGGALASKSHHKQSASAITGTSSQQQSSNLNRSEGVTSTGNIGSPTTKAGTTNPAGHNHGRGVAVVGGTDAVAYEAEKHHQSHEDLTSRTNAGKESFLSEASTDQDGKLLPGAATSLDGKALPHHSLLDGTSAAGIAGSGAGHGQGHSKHDSGYSTGFTGDKTTYGETSHKITPSENSPAGAHGTGHGHGRTSGPGLSGNTKFSTTGISLTGGEKEGNAHSHSHSHSHGAAHGTGYSVREGVETGTGGKTHHSGSHATDEGRKKHTGTGATASVPPTDDKLGLRKLLDDGRKDMSSDTGVANSAGGTTSDAY